MVPQVNWYKNIVYSSLSSTIILTDFSGNEKKFRVGFEPGSIGSMICTLPIEPTQPRWIARAKSFSTNLFKEKTLGASILELRNDDDVGRVEAFKNLRGRIHSVVFYPAEND